MGVSRRFPFEDVDEQLQHGYWFDPDRREPVRKHSRVVAQKLLVDDVYFFRKVFKCNYPLAM
jgi:hypothetical protein